MHFPLRPLSAPVISNPERYAGRLGLLCRTSTYGDVCAYSDAFLSRGTPCTVHVLNGSTVAIWHPNPNLLWHIPWRFSLNRIGQYKEFSAPAPSRVTVVESRAAEASRGILSCFTCFLVERQQISRRVQKEVNDHKRHALVRVPCLTAPDSKSMLEFVEFFSSLHSQLCRVVVTYRSQVVDVRPTTAMLPADASPDTLSYSLFAGIRRNWYRCSCSAAKHGHHGERPAKLSPCHSRSRDLCTTNTAAPITRVPIRP